jgi:lipopolysaccharide transport system permease protein
VYVLTGMCFWCLFADAVQGPLRSIAEARPILIKVNFPREALVLTGLGEALFAFMVRLSLLGAALAWYGIAPAPTAGLALAAALVLLCMGAALGLVLAPFGLMYQDVGRGVALLLQFWMYLTPVVYLPPVSLPAALVNVINPVSAPLVAARDWLLLGEAGPTPVLMVGTIAAVAALVPALLFFRLALPAALDRLGA